MRLLYYIVILLIFSVATSCTQTDYSNILVIKVVDGDTLRLAGGEKLRLIGIDTPEMYESDKLYRDAQKTGQDIRTIMAQGRKSYQFTQKLVESKIVSLEFDEEKYDDYGRLLAYVFLPDGTFVNTEIVKQGYARPLAIEPNTTYADIIYQLYWQAQQEKRGLWE